MGLTDLILIIIVNVITLIITFLIFYKRSKKLIYKYFDKSKTENQEFIKYIGNIENRLKKEIKDDKLIHTNNNLDNNISENWALIVSFNRGELIKNLITDIKKYENNIKIIVIDNGSKSNTINILIELKLNGLIDLLILNTNNLTPQWQKSYAIYQGIELLKMREIVTLTILDDDINVTANWINLANVIFEKNQDIKITNMMDDNEQEKVHKTIQIREIEYNKEILKIKIKETFNGAFFCLKFSTLLQMGYPPISEGINDSSVEDWYYSRILKSNNWLIAALDHSKHLGYDNSIRESIVNE